MVIFNTIEILTTSCNFFNVRGGPGCGLLDPGTFFHFCQHDLKEKIL